MVERFLPDGKTCRRDSDEQLTGIIDVEYFQNRQLKASNTPVLHAAVYCSVYCFKSIISYDGDISPVV